MKYRYWLLIFVLFITSCNYKKDQKEQPEYNASHYYNAGVLCDYNGDHKEALNNYNKAIALDSTISNYYLNRGATIQQVYNDMDKALEDYRKAIQLDAHNAIAYYNIGCVLSDQGNDQDASEFYRICIAIDPLYYPAYYNCAHSQYGIKDYEEALKNFEKAIQYDDRLKFYAYYYMGMIYKETGKPDKAKSYFEKAKALGNKNAEDELNGNK